VPRDSTPIDLSSDKVVQEALASLSPVERLLWGRSVRVGLSRPQSRISRFVPMYGVRGATYAVVGNIWLLPGVVAFLASLAFLPMHRTGAESVVFWLCIGVLIISLASATYRIITATMAIRRFRQGTFRREGP
jgi:hypothetical protein